MNEAFRKYVEAASGMAEVTRKRAERMVRNLVKQGEVAADDKEKAVEDLLARVEQNRKAVVHTVKAETQRAVSALGLARQRDVDRLEAKVRALEAELATEPAAKKAAKKSAAAKKATAKKATAKKATAKKATAKKVVAKKVVANKAAQGGDG